MLTLRSLWQDLPAMVAEVRRAKLEEEDVTADSLDISCVAHSMGAACVLMYALLERRAGRPCPFRRLVLLSPAGLHPEVPSLLACAAALLRLLAALGLLRLLPVVRFPGDLVRVLTAKLVRDIATLDPLRQLATLLPAWLLGGPRQGSHPIWRVHARLPLNVLQGTPVKVLVHFAQLFSSGRFQAFDHGPRENFKRWPECGGRPLDFGRLYGLLDVPTHFLAGMRDHLIPPSCIQAHFALLSARRPHLAHLRTMPDSGHLDFTLGLTEEILAYVVRALLSPDPPATMEKVSSQQDLSLLVSASSPDLDQEASTPGPE